MSATELKAGAVQAIRELFVRWSRSTTTLRSRRAVTALTFALLMAGYAVSFSFDENDALDTAHWMQTGEIALLLEFRHLIQRMLPLWLWQGMNAIGWKVEALTLLNAWDIVTAALSVMLLYKFLLEITKSAPISFWGSFGYATAHCVWVYTGSGRLYSTSMLFIFGAFYLALQMNQEQSGRKRWLLAFGSGAYVCLAGLFWLVHVFGGIGVALLLALLPRSVSLWRRAGYLAVHGATGLVLVLVIGASCLQYVGIPLEVQAIKEWMTATGTQPMTFDALSPMKAAYGQAHGVLAMRELPFIINAIMLGDPVLRQIGSLPWQLSKFIFVWILLTLVYLYPWYLFWKSGREKRLLIASFYVPLSINMYFALGWLGTDVQRFMPTMLPQFGLAALSVQDLLLRVRRPRALAFALCCSLVFIAADNLWESLLPSQTAHISLKQSMAQISHSTRPQDLLVNFGRDLPISYQTATRYYGGAQIGLTTTNDAPAYDWDRADWREEIERLRTKTERRGGRMFMMDRLALGTNPVSAAWSERQHPNPTVKQFAAHLRMRYCVIPAIHVGVTTYYLIAERNVACPISALAPERP